MSEVKVNKISPRSGTAFTLGDSGDTFTVPSGATLTTTNATVNLPASVGGLGTGIDVTSQITGVVPPANLGTGSASSSTILYGDGTFKTEPGGNIPGFQAYLSASQTGITQNTWVKAEIDTEVYDSDGTYDNSSNYRFTPAVAGKYFVFGQIYFTAPGERFYDIYISIYKNGSSLIEDTFDSTDSGNITQSRGVFGIVDLGASDYVELFGKGVTIGSADVSFIGSAKYDTHFGGFKVG